MSSTSWLSFSLLHSHSARFGGRLVLIALANTHPSSTISDGRDRDRDRDFFRSSFLLLLMLLWLLLLPCWLLHAACCAAKGLLLRFDCCRCSTAL